MTWVCKKIEGQLAGCSYNMNISNLEYETNYEYRAYYHIDGERYCGNILTGRTPRILTKPVVQTSTQPILTTCNTARVSGKIIDKGNSSISQYGILYGIIPYWGSSADIDFPDDTSTTPKPGVRIVEGLNPENVQIDTTLSFNISNLSPETKYYYRFFARNSDGYTNGNLRDFTTIGDVTPDPDPDPGNKFTVTPSTAHFAQVPELCTLTVTIPNGCAWSVSASSPSDTYINPTSGVGSGSFVFKPPVNKEYENKLGSINVIGQDLGTCLFSFTQDGSGFPTV